jgi:hypothetical protein
MHTPLLSRRTAIGLALAVVLPYSLAACATGRHRAPTAADVAAEPTSNPGARPRRAHDVITAEQLASAGEGSALEALRRLRPELFRGAAAVHAAGARGAPLVLYVDGIRQGPMALLADIRAAVVAEVRYYRPGEALSWFGPGHEGGVVAVRIRKGP